MKSATTPCALCRAVSENAIEVRRIYDSHLFSTDNFVVIPSLGPIRPGHLMVVSRSHILNLASMGQKRISEYRSLVDSLAKRAGFGELLQAEHGSSQTEAGGACITHAHVNLIPEFSYLVDKLDLNLPRLEVDYDLQTLAPEAAPYILLRGEAAVRLYKAQSVPSQLIRRVLFAEFGRDDWDWAVFPNLNVVQHTLELWGNESHG